MSNQKKSALVGVSSLVLLVGLAGCSLVPRSSSAPTVGTPAPSSMSSVKVTGMDVGRSLGPDGAVSDRTDNFGASDTFYVSVKTEGAASSATITVRWTYEDGQLVNESTQTIAPNGSATHTEFHVSKLNGWSTGAYKVTVLLQGVSAGHRDFRVS